MDVSDAGFIQGWYGIFFVCNLGLGFINNLVVFVQ